MLLVHGDVLTEIDWTFVTRLRERTDWCALRVQVMSLGTSSKIASAQTADLYITTPGYYGCQQKRCAWMAKHFQPVESTSRLRKKVEGYVPRRCSPCTGCFEKSKSSAVETFGSTWAIDGVCYCFLDISMPFRPFLMLDFSEKHSKSSSLVEAQNHEAVDQKKDAQ